MKTERNEESQLQRAGREGGSFATPDSQFRPAEQLARVGRYYEALLMAEEVEAGHHRARCHATDHSQCG